MPAYASDGKVVCFFQAAEKFNARYATFGFNDAANLDKGTMWPTTFALKELTAADEKKLGALVKKAVRADRGQRIVLPRALATSSTASCAVAFSRSRIGFTSTTSSEPTSPDSATSSSARCASR